MNKTELINEISAKSDISKGQAKVALETFLSSVVDTLKSGDRVSLIGFGSWSVSRREARDGRNPRTNEPLSIPAKNVVKFKAGSEFTDAIN